jgi:pilus assembly protein Flp/PilA
MTLIVRKMRRLLAAEDGPTAVEYAVMLALIVIVCLAAIRTVGVQSMNTFRITANSVAS